MANQEIDTLNQIVHSIDILLVSQKNKIKKIKLKKKILNIMASQSSGVSFSV